MMKLRHNDSDDDTDTDNEQQMAYRVQIRQSPYLDMFIISITSE